MQLFVSNTFDPTNMMKVEPNLNQTCMCVYPIHTRSQFYIQPHMVSACLPDVILHSLIMWLGCHMTAKEALIGCGIVLKFDTIEIVG